MEFKAPSAGTFVFYTDGHGLVDIHQRNTDGTVGAALPIADDYPISECAEPDSVKIPSFGTATKSIEHATEVALIKGLLRPESRRLMPCVPS